MANTDIRNSEQDARNAAWTVPVDAPAGGSGSTDRLHAQRADSQDGPVEDTANEEIQTGPNGERFVMIEGEKVDLPDIDEPTPQQLQQESVERKSNLENALPDKLAKSFQESSSETDKLTAELITREVVRELVAKLEKDGVSKPKSMFARKTSASAESRPATVQEIENSVRENLGYFLGSDTLTIETAGDNVKYQIGNKGEKQTVEVPIPSSNKLVTVEFTPLVSGTGKVEKVLCDSVKITDLKTTK